MKQTKTISIIVKNFYDCLTSVAKNKHASIKYINIFDGKYKQLIQQIYLYDILVDDEIAQKYLKKLGLDGEYSIDSILSDDNEVFKFVDWIPTLEELGVQLPTPMIVHSN